jgi:hypothetical protein
MLIQWRASSQRLVLKSSPSSGRDLRLLPVAARRLVVVSGGAGYRTPCFGILLRLLRRWPQAQQVLTTRRDADAVSLFETRMRPFRQRRLRAKLVVAGSVAIWAAGLGAVLLVAALAFAGLHSGR